MKRPSSDDIGLELINYVYDLMQIDSKWAVWEPRGFTWWGWRCAQRVWAEPPGKDGDLVFCRLHARTDVLDGYDGSDRQVALLGIAGRTMTLSGFIRSPQRPGRLQLASSVFVHSGTRDFVKALFSFAVSIQAAEGAIFADTLPVPFGMQPARSEHPESGPRTEKDGMLDIIEVLIRPEGQARSAYQGSEMKGLLAAMQRPPCVLATGDELGITAEFPYPNHTSLLEITTTSANPRVGGGLLALLTIPEGANDAATALQALEWNELELTSFTRAHFLGSWCPSERGITFAAFYPNSLYRAGCVQNLGMSHVMRAKWFTEEAKDYNWQEHFTDAYQRKVATLARIKAGGLSRGRGILGTLFGHNKVDD